MGHFWEYILVNDRLNLGFTEDGDCKGSVTISPPKAARLHFEFANEAISSMKTQYEVSFLL